MQCSPEGFTYSVSSCVTPTHNFLWYKKKKKTEPIGAPGCIIGYLSRLLEFLQKYPISSPGGRWLLMLHVVHYFVFIKCVYLQDYWHRMVQSEISSYSILDTQVRRSCIHMLNREYDILKDTVWIFIRATSVVGSTCPLNRQDFKPNLYLASFNSSARPGWYWYIIHGYHCTYN